MAALQRHDPPLKGIRVLELAGLAPGPFAGLILADFGASVLRIDRPAGSAAQVPDLLTRHKSSLILNLKSARSRAFFLSLLPHVDILIDPYRPGVLESLSLDPQTVLLKHNPRLIVVQLTGFRRDDQKYGKMAGHDINYLAVSGVLSMLGERGGGPNPPANILADFGGGGLVAALGAITALFARERTGKGQVVDANMVDGVGALGTFMRYGRMAGAWSATRGENLIDGGAPYYGTYEVKGGEHVAVGALEPQFFQELLKGLKLREEEVLMPGVGDRGDKRGWSFTRDVFERRFMEKTRKEWEEIFDGTDACVTPVLSFEELEKQGYEQRGITGLSETPGLLVQDSEGRGWTGKILGLGEGGEGVLKEWLGWEAGKHYGVEDGATVQLSDNMRSKL